MPINERKDGWYWGGEGPYKSRKKAEEVSNAAHASGYQKLEKQGTGVDQTQEAKDLVQGDIKPPEKPGTSDTALGFTPDELTQAAKQQAQQAKVNAGNPTEESVEDTKQKTQKNVEEYKKRNEKARRKSLEAYGEDPSKLFGLQNFIKEDGGAGIGTVAVSSDPGVFTDTYGARKRKVMNRKNTQTKKSEKSGPEKLDDYLNNTFKAIDDDTFLVELLTHVRQELSQEDDLRKGAGPYGTYTPKNERPDKPPFPQEIKRKGKGRSEEINRSPTTENTVPVSTGVGALGQSNIPQETAMAEVGVDDSRNMNRKNAYNSDQVRRQRKRRSAPSGVFLNPGDESGNNFQNTAVPFTAMQKMPTHGNVTSNTPKQFSTQQPQEHYIERKPRTDPNSDIEQEEFVGNVDSIRDEDKNRKGRTYENNKESNNLSTNRIDTYTMNMGGHALQALNKEMRSVGVLGSLHRQERDDITEPDDNESIPSTEIKDLLQAEKSAVKKMLDWINDLS